MHEGISDMNPSVSLRVVTNAETAVLYQVFFNSWNNMIKQRDDERYQFVCPCPCVRVNVTSECPVSI